MDFLYQFIQSGIDCTTFHRFFSWNVRNFFFFFFQKFTGLWLVGKVDNHVAIYGSKVAEGFSAFQRRLVLNYVLIVTFWIFIYHEIWILLNIFLYGTIELFILWHVWRYSGVLWVNSCPPLSRPHQAVWHEWALLHHWLCNQKHPWGICSCSPIVNFLKVTFYHGMVTLVIFLIKK